MSLQLRAPELALDASGCPEIPGFRCKLAVARIGPRPHHPSTSAFRSLRLVLGKYCHIIQAPYTEQSSSYTSNVIQHQRRDASAEAFRVLNLCDPRSTLPTSSPRPECSLCGWSPVGYRHNFTMLLFADLELQELRPALGLRSSNESLLVVILLSLPRAKRAPSIHYSPTLT